MPTLSQPTPEVLSGIVDASPDALVVVARDGAVRFANTAAESLFGRPRDELVGARVADLVPDLGLVVSSERLELVAVGPAGELPVEVWASPVSDAGEPLLAVTVRDLRGRPSLAEASARMRDDLIASVSHELRTPLTSIIGYTEILVDMGEQAVSQQAAELLSVIERNAARELRLVEDLLTLASLKTSGLAFCASPTDLVAVVADVVGDHASTATEAGVQLHHSGPSQLWVAGDVARLGQVVRNLVGNALKFTPAGGRVVVELSAQATHGVLVITDQGVGVAAEELPRVFERLYRGAHAVAAHLPGAGLGLPIVKGIVDAHGGDIDVESEQGRGTRFVVRIPLATG
ncbi:ATP-binding protein [Nocardioides euryhalodurans]|uniref:histidine kinase n=1 Tax=Nocardioides euryhalodurans TaxID=2518370 RepID=A0A4P7GIC6_9ACTN|nr:ATP-binding protein [Nocardioides euryhalodurans]QBR91708.1 PAS domain-containing protein [Nocardioides euryhalodurans]